MKKRKSPTESIEDIKNPELEHEYIKTPRNEIEDISINQKKDSVTTDYDNKIEKYFDKTRGRKKYTLIHNHPISTTQALLIGNLVLPSGADLYSFLSSGNRHQKTMMIAQQDPDTGKVAGYCVIRKTKKSPNYIGEYIPPGKERNKLLKDIEGLEEMQRKYPNSEEPFEEFCREYNLQCRQVPTKGHRYHQKVGFIEKPTLEKKITDSIIIAITLLAVIFGINNLTGFTIVSGITKGRVNLLLIVLLLIILVYYFLYKGKKNKRR